MIWYNKYRWIAKDEKGFMAKSHKKYQFLLFHQSEGIALLARFRIYWLYPLKRDKILPYEKKGILAMTLNCIW